MAEVASVLTGDQSGAGSIAGSGPQAALLIVVGEPFEEGQCELIRERVVSELGKWDEVLSKCSIDECLKSVTEKDIKAASIENGEIVFGSTSNQFRVVVLIRPHLQTLFKHIRSFLLNNATYRCLLFSGPVISSGTKPASAAWLLQDGTLPHGSLLDIFKSADVAATLHKEAIVDVIAPTSFDAGALAGVRVNPDTKPRVSEFAKEFVDAHIMSQLKFTALSELLHPVPDVSQRHVVVTERPTLQIFPAGQGTTSTFSVDGFNILIDAGYSRKIPGWEFIRRVSTFDAMILSQLGQDGIFGAGSFFERKLGDLAEKRLPDVGVVLGNLGAAHHHKEEKPRLIMSVTEEVGRIAGNLNKLGIQVLPCAAEEKVIGGSMKPINMMYSVSRGSLDLYVVTPVHGKQQKEAGDGTSMSAILNWTSKKPGSCPVRILLSAGVSRAKLFEGLDRLGGEKLFCSWTGVAKEKKGKEGGKLADVKGSGKPPSGKEEIKKEELVGKVPSAAVHGQHVKPAVKDVKKTIKDVQKNGGGSDGKESEKVGADATDSKEGVTYVPTCQRTNTKVEKKPTTTLEGKKPGLPATGLKKPAPSHGDIKENKPDSVKPAHKEEKDKAEAKDVKKHAEATAEGKKPAADNKKAAAAEGKKPAADNKKAAAAVGTAGDSKRQHPAAATAESKDTKKAPGAAAGAGKPNAPATSVAADPAKKKLTVKKPSEATGVKDLNATHDMKPPSATSTPKRPKESQVEKKSEQEAAKSEAGETAASPKELAEPTDTIKVDALNASNPAELVDVGVKPVDLMADDEAAQLIDVGVKSDNLMGMDEPTQQVTAGVKSENLMGGDELVSLPGSVDVKMVDVHVPEERPPTSCLDGLPGLTSAEMSGTLEVKAEGSFNGMQAGGYEENDGEEVAHNGGEVKTEIADVDPADNFVSKSFQDENQDPLDVDSQLNPNAAEFNPEAWEKPMGLPSPVPLEENDHQPIGAENAAAATNNNEKEDSIGAVNNSGDNIVEVHPANAVADRNAPQAAKPPQKTTTGSKTADTKRIKPGSSKTDDRLNTTTVATQKPAASAIKRGRASLMPGETPSAIKSSSNPSLSTLKPVPGRPGTSGASRVGAVNQSIVKPLRPVVPFYVDLAYIPLHSHAKDIGTEFFQRVRARYYILSTARPDPEIINQLVAARCEWDESCTGTVVTVVPTHDSEEMLHWMSENEAVLDGAKVVVAPSASRCRLQVAEEGGVECNCYRIEF